ncbi:hypothetical protein CcaCcLH18_02397 [Colletotrichum camelliae]|nr:hypothetical protein CcaCcLH18_02397 [Colletotrichum camelliae]
MASNPPRITPVPIPVPGHAPSPQLAPATSAAKVLSTTAANRNASPSSVSSAGEDPARKMKRTSDKVNVKPGAFLQAPPWAASLLSSKPSTSTSTGPLASPVGVNPVSGPGVPSLAPPTQDHTMVLDSPEPIRIESDILPPNPEGPVKSEFSPEDTPLEDVTPAKPSLSMSSKIQALQQSWQAKSTSADSQGPGEVIRRVSSGDVQPSRPALNWTQAKRKQSSGLLGGDPKRRLTENGLGSGSEDITADHGSSSRSMPASTPAEASHAPTSSAKPGFIPIKRQPLSVSSSDDNDMVDDDSTDSDSDSEPDAPVQLDSGNGDQPPPPFQFPPTIYGQPENELTTTNDGDRLYCQWKGENTPLEASCGALLPTKYTLHSDPEYPFICPDRLCRSIFRSIQGLGKHFGARHRNIMYNDNLDGTVSIVSFFDIPGTTRASPVIVSRNPLRGDEPPMPEPRTTTYKPQGGMVITTGMSQSQPQSQSQSQPQQQTTATRTTRSHASPYSTLPTYHEPALPSYLQSAKPMTLLEYLTSQLSPTYRLPAERPDFKALLKLPMARHFPPQWTMKHSGVGNLAPLTALSLLVFLTGDPAPVSCSTCNGPEHDAFENTLRPCVVLSSRAPSWLKETVNEACASCQWRCNYKRQKVQCDFLPAFRGRTLTALPSPAPAATPTPIPPPAVPPSSAPPSYNLPKNAKFPYGGPGSGGQSGVNSPALCSPAVTTPPVCTTPVNTSRPSSPPRRVTRHSAATKTASDSALVLSNSSTKPAAAAVVPSTAGQTMPAELLDMEEWEIAPGRVRDDQSQEPTNVAFSNAYLTSNQAVSVSEDIAFNVIVIKPGGSHRWTDEEDKVRICSVAVGKVKVKLDMTDPFQIGPNGMFKLKPGMSCSIENRTYIDAIIHVTSVTLY